MKLHLTILEFLFTRRFPCIPQLTASHIVPWMFILDHWNCARWMSVHISDWTVLKTCPSVDAEFKKHLKKFSMLVDIVYSLHEQLNARVKGQQGIGITENDNALT